MTQTNVKPKKTRWGCLSIPIILTLIFCAARIYDMWYEKQPLAVHLRDVFKESGFEVPDYVTDIEGSKGWVDFQGDYSAVVTFTVKREDLKKFMTLPKVWKTPGDFKPIDHEESVGGLNVPVGSYVIEEWTSSEYNCKYAVDEESNRIYFYRSST
jgi:hypothetical protein